MIATIETILEDQLPQRAADMGEYLIQQLNEKVAVHPFVNDVRGLGLLIGIECKEPVNDIVLEGQKRGLLFVTAGPNVIRLLPNLYITKEEIDQAVGMIAELIHDHTAVNKA